MRSSFSNSFGCWDEGSVGDYDGEWVGAGIVDVCESRAFSDRSARERDVDRAEVDECRATA